MNVGTSIAGAYQIVGVIAVLDGLMATVGSMHMRGAMAVAVVVGCAAV